MVNHSKLLRLFAGASISVVAFACAAHAQENTDGVTADEIIVTGQRAAINSAIAEERQNDTLTNIITSDDVGQFGDQNSAEALARLPGITIERSEGEGRSVSVRGLPSSFTQVTVNGARIGTSDPGSSTAALDVIPSDLLGRIIVNKSFTPDMDGDTIGGSVELQSLSAYQSPKELTNARLEGSYSRYADKIGPKGSLSLTRRLAGNTVGVALSLSYFKRHIEGDDLRNEDGLSYITRNATNFVYPNEVNQRFEIGERDRLGATVNLEFRPYDGQEFFLRGQFSSLKDRDIRIQSQWQTARATGSEVLDITDTSGRFRDVRLRNQIFFQPTTDRLWTISAGTKNQLGDWNLSSQFDWSRSRWSQKDGIRGRFLIDDIGQTIEWSESGAFTDRFRDGTRPDPFNLAAYQFADLLFIEEERDDQIITGQFNVQRDLGSGFIKAGVKYRTRSKEADKVEYNASPGLVGLGTTNLSTIPLLTRQPRFQTFGPFPALAEAQTLFTNARDRLLAIPAFQRQDNSAASDYRVDENVLAGYFMANIDFDDTFKLITGARVEKTSFESDGFFIETDDSGLNAADVPITPIRLATVTRNYTDWLPSILLRIEPTSRLLGRLSYARGVKRPDFDEVSNRQRVGFSQTDPDGTRQLVSGNPFLKALTADQFDASLSWYPTNQTAFQVALFHKEIRDFFVDFETDNFADTGLVLPPGVSTTFDRIETVINGAKARVSGVEFSGSHNFSSLPGLLSGLFVTGNVTLAKSRAEISQRAGERFPFPGQADFTANASVGWENDDFSLRYSVTHTGETLRGIASRIEEDRYRKPYTQHDINVRLQITDTVQLYGDAINVTNEKDTTYYQGIRTGVFEQVEDFGATYQVGVRVTF
jgi:iron complex outermembrane recepter protein